MFYSMYTHFYSTTCHFNLLHSFCHNHYYYYCVRTLRMFYSMLTYFTTCHVSVIYCMFISQLLFTSSLTLLFFWMVTEYFYRHSSKRSKYVCTPRPSSDYNSSLKIDVRENRVNKRLLSTMNECFHQMARCLTLIKGHAAASCFSAPSN